MSIDLDLSTADPEQLAKVFNQLESGEEVKAADPPPEPTTHCMAQGLHHMQLVLLVSATGWKFSRLMMG